MAIRETRVREALEEFLVQKAEEIRSDWGIEFDDSLVGNGDEYAMDEDDLSEMDAVMEEVAAAVESIAAGGYQEPGENGYATHDGSFDDDDSDDLRDEIGLAPEDDFDDDRY